MASGSDSSGKPGASHVLAEAGADGMVRTEDDCTECRKHFVAMIDGKLNGNHKIRCPYCGHIHWRVVKDGKVTQERWNGSAGQTFEVGPKHVWKSAVQPIQTSTASAFIRDRWIGKAYNEGGGDEG